MKQKRTDSLLWLIITVVLSALCAIARRWQLNTAFEGELNLPIPVAPATIVLLCLFVIAAASLILLCRKQIVDPALRQDSALALYANDEALFLGAVLCAAFLTLVAAPALFRDGFQMWREYQSARFYGDKIPGGNNGLLILVTAVTSALAFIALLVIGKRSFRGTTKGRLAILLPAINNCLWLMEIYRYYAADPVRWNYTPLLLAIVFGILLYLDWAGLYAGICAPRRTLWMAGMTVVFSATALAGSWSFGSAMLLFSQLIAALAVLWCVPKNLRYPPEPIIEAAPAVEEKLEEETHE